MPRKVDYDVSGMEEMKQNTPTGDQLRDVKLGNSAGDVVDNSAGTRGFNDDSTSKSTARGASLGIMSKPSWLYPA